MPIYQRIKELAFRKNFSAVDVAESSDIKLRTAQNYLSGKPNNYPDSFLSWIARQYPEVNLRWLLLGEGPMENNAMYLNEENTPYQKTLQRLNDVIETLTKRVNELPALRERIIALEKEIEKIKKG